MAESREKIKVLIAHEDTYHAEKLDEYLSLRGFECARVRKGSEVTACLESWPAEFILYSLRLSELNALQYLKSKFRSDAKHRPDVLVLSAHNLPQNRQECRNAGAVDFLPSPPRSEDVFARLILHSQKRRQVEELKEREAQEASGAAEGTYFLHLSGLMIKEVLRGEQATVVLFNLTRMLSLALKAVRVSIIEVDAPTLTGKVWASSDRKDINYFQLDLTKYPEVTYVVEHGTILALDNLDRDPKMQEIAKLDKSIQFNSMIVVPISYPIGAVKHQFGVLSVRFDDRRKATNTALSDNEIRLADMCAQLIALTLAKEGPVGVAA